MIALNHFKDQIQILLSICVGYKIQDTYVITFNSKIEYQNHLQVFYNIHLLISNAIWHFVSHFLTKSLKILFTGKICIITHATLLLLSGQAVPKACNKKKIKIQLRSIFICLSTDRFYHVNYQVLTVFPSVMNFWSSFVYDFLVLGLYFSFKSYFYSNQLLYLFL